MNVSSVAPPPIAVVAPNHDQTRQDDQARKSQDTDPTYQPQPPAPLPPGQGTRIDQLA